MTDRIDNKKLQIIFWLVFIFSFVIQLTKFSFYLHDGDMWAAQIDNFLNKKPALFDYYLAYGHPGGIFVLLGCFFHLVCGLSYDSSLLISLSLSTALATAACARVSFLLQPQTIWWFATAFILTMSRFYNTATPPTIVAMPLITLLILWLFLILKRGETDVIKYSFIWSVLLGVSAATRLDISIFVGFPLVFFLLRWSGPRGIFPVLAGITMSFVVCDPFMWFMPFQHISDLFHKFSLHYVNFPGHRLLPWYEWGNGFIIATINIAWFLVILFRRRLGNVVQTQLMLALLGITIIAVLLLVTSRYQSIRYLYPLITFWEIIVPMYALEQSRYIHEQRLCLSVNLDKLTVWVILCFIIPSQVLGYAFAFVHPY